MTFPKVSIHLPLTPQVPLPVKVPALVTGVAGETMSGKDPLDPELSSVGVPVRRRLWGFSSNTAASRVSVTGGEAWELEFCRTA